jgi:hypothetical protein
MTEEAVEGTTTETTTDPGVVEAPTDFREFVKWRTTGELPKTSDKTDTTSAAAEETPPAKTEPDSETEDPQEPEEEEGEETTDDGTPRRRGGSRQRKIDRLTREVEELKRQVQQPAPAPQPAAAQAAPSGRPKLENFETLEAYQEALTDWKLDERERVRREAETQRLERERVDQLQTDWSKREKTAKRGHSDYDDVVGSVAVPPGPGVVAMRQALLEDDAGAEVLYYLGKHPAELKRIVALTPLGAVKETGKLLAQFQSSPAPENGKPKISSAPRPPSPVSRPAKTSSDSIDDPDVQRDFKRWSRAREAQLKGR